MHGAETLTIAITRLQASALAALLSMSLPAWAIDEPATQMPKASPIEIQALSQPPGAPVAPKTDVSLDDLAIPSPLGDMALGSKEAPVTVVEYASMTCSHCADFSKTSFPRLKSDYVDTGKVRYVFREFPLDIKAVAGSILARCIAKGDATKFFALTEELFRTQDVWIAKNTGDEFKALARRQGMEEKDFEACFADQNAIAGIQRTQDVAADKLKVTSTPSFFVNGVLVKGNLYPEIEKAIQAAK
jgi:protein-disulfide isomerase